MHANQNQYLLHKTDNGSVIQCSCCQNLQLAFGNLILKLEYDHFLNLMKCIDQIDPNKPQKASLPNGKQYLIKLPNNIAFAFSQNEVEELKELLNWSQASLKVRELIKSEF